MAIYVKPKWRKYIPHFEIFLSFPIVRVQMVVFSEELACIKFIYLGVQWQIHKWEGKIAIYEVGREVSLNRLSYITEDDIKKIDNKGCFISEKYKIRHYCDKHFKNEK